jgi:hypothetical protein
MINHQTDDGVSPSVAFNETPKPRIFHIHVDAQYISPAFLKAVLNIGFDLDNFGQHPEFVPYFGPNFMLSLKTQEGSVFKEKWNNLEKAMNDHPIRGYAEGEFIPSDHAFENKPFNGTKPNFHISRRKLHGGLIEPFRESEIHLSMDADRSNPDLIRGLIEAGLYAAYYKKPQGNYIILTIQGSKSAVEKIKSLVQNYVEKAGGTHNGTLKEEIAIKHRLCGVNHTALPEVIDEIFVPMP